MVVAVLATVPIGMNIRMAMVMMSVLVRANSSIHCINSTTNFHAVASDCFW